MANDAPGHGWAIRKRAMKIRNEGDPALQVSQWQGWNCLCHAEVLPRWHFKHRRLKSGYRYCPTFKAAFFSLFYWHNESVNVWSHYLSTILLLVFGVYTWLDADRNAELLQLESLRGGTVANFESMETLQPSIWLLFITNIFGNILPIFLSAFCHQFYCISKRWHSFCWFMDFIGILSGMFSTGIGWLYLSLYCFPLLMHTFLYGLLVCFIIAMQVCWRRYSFRTGKPDLIPVDRFPEFSAILSTFGYVATVIPVLFVIVYLPEYTQDPEFLNILLSSVSGPVIMGCSIVLFAQGNFPERYAVSWGLPENYFDFLGHSHQLWHFVSAILQFCWIYILRRHFEIRLEHSCVNSSHV
mmetsp:Transcript_20126/g.33672  ORF Transcript_20126/g.33672 Transcript_20126/m.33672 type:complete len:355 (+) Transcript_20126:88-1152(+)